MNMSTSNKLAHDSKDPRAADNPVQNIINIETIISPVSNPNIVSPNKRKLGPKPLVENPTTSPILKKIKTRQKIAAPVKIHPILPKPSQVTIKKQVLRSKPLPPQETQVPCKNNLSESVHQTSSETEIRDTFEDSPNEDEENQQQEQKEQALLRACSTIVPKQMESKLNKQQKKLQTRISALSSQKDSKGHAKCVALAYLKRANELLPAELFEQFLEILQKFNQNTDTPEKLYSQICELVKDYPTLVEDFIVILKPSQALKIGKYKEYCLKMNILEFSKKLQHQYGEQWGQLQKILKTIHQMTKQTDITWEHVHSMMVPHLRHPHLIESLSQCFPDAKPMQSLSGDFEEIDLDQASDDDDMETINLLDEKVDQNCEQQCSCLNKSNCQPVLKFIDGRVYVQQGKSLRPAKVTYLCDPKEEKPTTETKPKQPRRLKNTKSSLKN